MKSHLAITLNGEYLDINEDTSIDLEFNNPYFNDTASETLSLPFTVPLAGNRNKFGNAEVVDSDNRLTRVEGGVMGVETDGVLMASGKTGNIEDQELHDEVALQMVSSVYSLDEYLNDLRCRDVQMKDRIQVGEGIGNLQVQLKSTMEIAISQTRYVDKYSASSNNKFIETFYTEIKNDLTSGMTLPALGFSRPDICKVDSSGITSYQKSDGSEGKEPTVLQSFINVTEPYDPGRGYYYCNGRICYLHYKKADDGTSSDTVDTRPSIDQYSKYNPYLVLEADRPASGLCFYVLYFLDCLFYMFRKDGIAYDNSELLRVPDLKRLAFFTTGYKFETEPKMGLRPLNSIDEINTWLTSRNIQTKLEVKDKEESVKVDSITVDGTDYIVGKSRDYHSDPSWNVQWDKCKTDDITVKHKKSSTTISVTAQVMEYIANSQNFPDADAKTILDSLWASFGIRFYLDQETRVVKPRFIRDIFRDPSAPIVFPCQVITATKMTEKITGFRMKYSGESDDKSKKDNLINGTTNYDTTYDYCDYSQPNISFNYIEIVTKAYDSNMTLYVDLLTGNRYRVKIDGEAETRSEYHPVIFEVGQLTGVAIGDCSKENEEFVTELTSSFEPIIFNDVNNINQRKAFSQSDTAQGYYTDERGNKIQCVIGTVTKYEKSQKLAPFVDDDMWHEFIPRVLSYPIGTKYVDIDLNATIKTLEAFDPADSKTGDSPLQDHDWGLGVVMMRGGGSEAYIDYYDYNYDMFGNCKYRQVAGGDYTLSFDSIDCFGSVYDYNGQLPGIGDETSISYYNGPYSNRYDGTYTRSQAADKIREIWKDSNADLLSSRRKVSGSKAFAAGWQSAEGADYCTVLSSTRCLTDSDGVEHEFLCTPITDNGDVLSPSSLDSYMARLESLATSLKRSIMSLDALADQDEAIALGVGRHLIIQRFDNVSATNNYHDPWSDFYSEILHQFHAIYYGSASSGKVACPIPPASSDDRFSLKIRSYIPSPYDIADKNGQQFKKGDPLCNPAVARRGLFDTFMSEYAHFLLNRKRIKLEVACEPSALTHIEWHRRYQFGHYTGWIDKIQTHISAQNGIESVTIELLVL